MSVLVTGIKRFAMGFATFTILEFDFELALIISIAKLVIDTVVTLNTFLDWLQKQLHVHISQVLVFAIQLVVRSLFRSSLEFEFSYLTIA